MPIPEKHWNFEGDVFNVIESMTIPDKGNAGNGSGWLNTCPFGEKSNYVQNELTYMIPLYRLYNNGIGGAPNHRYTTDIQIAYEMRNKGWTWEGEQVTHTDGRGLAYGGVRIYKDEFVFACLPL